MELLIKAPGALIAIFGAILFFLAALCTGTWKYFSIRTSPTAEAPYYVNIAHRAALMYSLAALLLSAATYSWESQTRPTTSTAIPRAGTANWRYSCP
ncbi:MAG: hypothetical protein ACREUU_20715 [Gammaproteobacteria bacterium]